ncbi:hypothetical protein [Salinispora arenicola]|uniref:hypothetical protein n=1 Tax=Salinispora arenicola TaxID=168697 RepID=UPI0027DCD2DF|nr:hypothetical protein [Salinispora arenicola]
MNDAAQVVVDWARPRVSRRSGRAARSLRVASTGKAVRVRAGGARVPYYPWLDFGGPRRSWPFCAPPIPPGRPLPVGRIRREK